MNDDFLVSLQDVVVVVVVLVATHTIQQFRVNVGFGFCEALVSAM